ncbi:MAG: signal peptidase II [Clostridia bacterium]|nr:signal peptidase II [Clostridia bacterium]
MISYILSVIVGILFFIADRYTKNIVASTFYLSETKDFIPGFIDFTYIHNRGGAWGMLSGYTWLLVSMTVIIMLVCIALLLKWGFKDKLMFWAVSLIFFGGLGNMYDRLFNGGNVVDFIHLSFMPEFPVFNVADCAIVIGAGLFILYFVIGMIKESREKKEIVIPEDKKDE